MELIKPGTKIPFMKYRLVFITISMILTIASVVSLVAKGGPKYGIDFAGGVLVHVKFLKEAKTAEVRDALEGLGLGGIVVQQFGEEKASEYLVRVEKTAIELPELQGKIEQALKDRFGTEGYQVLRAEIVGPKVGADLRKKGFLALLYANIGILIYVAYRFEFRFALGAVLALVHDALITVGMFSILNKEVDLVIVAAVLTIIGYSVNDTVVIFDRIRENMRKIRKQDLEQLMDTSINETLSRTVLTSGATLITTVALFLFGGPVIHDFAFAMTFGIIIGTYSSIFIASPYVLYWDIFRNRYFTKTAAARVPAKRPSGRQTAEKQR
jgi:preprotein translocase subunit SecF